MAVDFIVSGTLNKIFDSVTGNEVTSGKTIIINQDIDYVIKAIDHSALPVDYSISGMHTSKDEYLVATYSYGYVGDSRVKTGFSPTTEVSFNNFQDVKDSSSGIYIISGTTFEGASVSGFDIVVSGTGISASGLISGTQLDGDYYVGLKASGDSILVLKPTVSGASGLSCGRIVFLSRLPANNTSVNEGVGVAFLPQGSDLTSSGYKVVCRNSSLSDNIISLYKGSVLSASSIFTGTELYSSNINYTALEKRIQEANRKVWIVVEWEGNSNNTSINFGYKTYVSGDTPTSIINEYTLVAEYVDMGYVGGSENGSPFYTTVDPVLFLLNSTNNDDFGLVGIDNIYIESKNYIDNSSISKLNLLDRNTDLVSGAIRPLWNNVLLDDGALPEASINYTTNLNMLLPNGLGYRGLLQSYRGGNSATDIASTISEIVGVGSSGIIYGNARFCVNLEYVASNNKSTFGFCFLRQGSTIDSNAYVMRYQGNSSSDGQVVLYKGQVYGSPITDSTSFSGSVLSTSTTITGCVGKNTWIDVRWKANSSLSKTDIDVYAVVGNDEVNNLNLDSSPGNIDYRLIKILEYTDNVSPYLNTIYNPMLICQSTQGCDLFLRQIELRRGK